MRRLNEAVGILLNPQARKNYEAQLDGAKSEAAIAPVIVISGIGLLLLSITNRYGRAIDRARLLMRELQTSDAGSAHDLQVPPQALPQHTPCSQKPDAHSGAVVQLAPMPLSTQALPQ